MKTYVRRLGIVWAGLSVAVSPAVAQAVNFLPSGVNSSDIELGQASPTDVAVNVVNWSLGILALIAVVFIIFAGFSWMTSGGNEKQIETAKGILKAAIIGLVIILTALGVSQYVFAVLINATGATAT